MPRCRAESGMYLAPGAAKEQPVIVPPRSQVVNAGIVPAPVLWP